MDGDGDVGDADHAPADHHDDHRDDGFPGTTEDSGGTVGEGQQEIEEGGGPGLGGSTLDDFRRTVEGGNHIGNEDEHDDTHQLRQSDGTEDAEPGAFFHAVIFLRTDILAGEGGHRQGKAGHGEKSEALHF